MVVEGAEFENRELLIIETEPLLAKQDGARTSELHKQSYGKQHWRHQRKEQECADLVQGQFDEVLKRRERPLQYRSDADICGRSKAQVRRKTVEDYEVDVGGCPFKPSHKSCYPLMLSDRRRKQY